MKELLELAKSLLEWDMRAKNAISFFVALLSVVAFYFTSRHYEWFRELRQEDGVIAVPIALVVVFLIVFLGTWLVYSGIAVHHERVVLRQRSEQKAAQQQKAIRDNLASLTSWQRNFVLRFITESKRQISDWEVGRFNGVWENEVDVLIAKGIVKEHRSNGIVYEIEPLYYAFLKEHWKPEDQALQ